MKLIDAKTSLKVHIANNNLNPDLLKIIDWCSLVPMENYYIWTDQISHILSIKKDICQVKKVELPSQVYDLYCKAPAQDLVDKSIKIVAIMDKEAMMLFCLGKDSKLRICFFHKKWKKNIFPLDIDFTTLLQVVGSMRSNTLDLSTCNFNLMESSDLTFWSGINIIEAADKTTCKILQQELIKLSKTELKIA
jgi:hypothetical protein